MSASNVLELKSGSFSVDKDCRPHEQQCARHTPATPYLLLLPVHWKRYRDLLVVRVADRDRAYAYMGRTLARTRALLELNQPAGGQLREKRQVKVTWSGGIGCFNSTLKDRLDTLKVQCRRQALLCTRP